MSEENVDLLRPAYALFNLNAVVDGKLDALFDEIADPEIVIIPPPVYPDEASSFRGLEESKAFFRRLAEVWEDWRFVPEDFLAAGDYVVVIGYLHAKGKGSGAEIDTPGAHVWSFRDGKATQVQVHLNRGEALEAAGLSE
jgi:ketosteroid isomerase-like protein